MYTYICSKNECQAIWTANEGNLNGFVLTCPLCGKGRGIFIGQTQRQLNILKTDGHEEMIIKANIKAFDNIRDLENKLNEFALRYNLNLIDKEIDTSDDGYSCRLKYKHLR